MTSNVAEQALVAPQWDRQERVFALLREARPVLIDLGGPGAG